MELTRLRFRRTCVLLVLLVSSAVPSTAVPPAAVVGGEGGPVLAAVESFLPELPRLYDTVKNSIVRVEKTDSTDGPMVSTGVIVSPDGHVLVGNGFAMVNGLESNEVKIHLSDGRTVTASRAGWSLEWRLCVVKIKETGPWPAIELGSTKDLKAGSPCLVMGIPTRGDTRFDVSPAARYGFVDRTMPACWLTTTCFPELFDASAVVGMDGRLLGVYTCFAGDQSYVTAVDQFTANRVDFFAGKNLDWVRYPPSQESFYRVGAGAHPEMLSLRKGETALVDPKPPATTDVSQLRQAEQIAKQSIVRLVSKDRLSFDGEHYDRWSGVVVSKDGFIATCAHTEHLPGERLTVRFSDGRDADAVALGTNPIADVALAKITSPGPWPCAEIGDSSTLKPGDPVVLAGYPAIENREFSLTRTPRVYPARVRHRVYLLWAHYFDTEYIRFHGGMSGGGAFDRRGRYVGVFMGETHHRSEVVKLQWDKLKQTESIDTAIGVQPPLKKRFVAAGEGVSKSLVEILVDSEPAAIGIIVGADGLVLTKASVLSGNVTCRLPDQTVVSGEKRAESSEHDLAILNIDASGLDAAEFHPEKPPTIGQVLCAVAPGESLHPGIVSVETRAIPPEPRWKGEAAQDSTAGPALSRGLNSNGLKLRRDDIITSINGHSTPSVPILAEVLRSRLDGYLTGDLVSVTLRRHDKAMKVRTSLPPAPGGISWMMGEHDTPRRSGFAAVFDTDIAIQKRQVGCPVIDTQGRILGVAIASRGRNKIQRGPTSVLPSQIVDRVAMKLMAEATDN
ncbi:Periplasmic pH-dependent serine endoprotease DegQ precursor [Stieleria maiorica]|uniref:Periplasmic pH-dependent serine endoprotease DegQ n=2 Tax=Stieleria maiorica TaxID=2795974 RepID=A0A5B9MMR8_9BACT|nr:Periplasmic pH-dependent serine endoprotease DegQ precursor [Stieleria maiorica]